MYFASDRNRDFVETFLDVPAFAESERAEASQLLIKVLIRESETIEFTREQKTRIQQLLEEISENLEEYEVQLHAFGIAIEKYGSFKQALYFLEDHDAESWAREAWLRVKDAQIAHHEKQGQTEKVQSLKQSRSRRVAKWSKDSL